MVLPIQAGRNASLDTIDIDKTILSGQVFLWQKIGDKWYGVDGSRLLRITMAAGRVEEARSFPDENQDAVARFLRLDDDMESIVASISIDPFISNLVRAHRGLRLLRQDPRQCLVSFLCASNTNIQMIRRMLSQLCAKLGETAIIDGHKFHLFPTPERLAQSSLEELRTCGLGYRAGAVHGLAVKLSNKEFDIDACRKMDYARAKEELMSLDGVGNKIADCVLLFAFDKLESFPIDVWIARALASVCGLQAPIKFAEKLTPNQYKVLSESARSRYGYYAGYAQQLIYYHIRQVAGKKW
ncbi:MAG: DNA glycosylase [Nitrososphaera sp.]